MVTPFGLAGPYELLHGGVQGDSMGVGSFTLVGIFRSRAHRTMVVYSLKPETGGQGGPDPAEYCYFHPAFPDYLKVILRVPLAWGASECPTSCRASGSVESRSC